MRCFTEETTAYKPLVHGERIRIAFLFQIASLWPSWESFYRECLEDERFDVRMFLVRDGIDTSNQVKSAQGFLDGNRIHYEIFSDAGFEGFDPHAAVVQTPYECFHRKPNLYCRRLKRLGIRVIYIPYGIELADTADARHDHFREAVPRHAWRIYTMSDGIASEYRRYCSNSSAVRTLGVPRFDSLLQKERFVLPPALRARAGSRKIIVWHAHFTKSIHVDGANRQVTPYLEEYIAFAGLLQTYEQYFFIFLPHPRFGDDVNDQTSNALSAELISLIQKSENAFVDWSDDYRPALLGADAIITDRSALMIESALPDVPVLFLQNPDYRESMLKPLIPLIESYSQGTGCLDMKAFLNLFNGGIDSNKEKRSTAIKTVIPYLDGKCSERIKEDICTSMLEETSESDSCAVHPAGKVKIVLFGAGFLFHKFMGVFEFPSYCDVVAITDNDREKWGKIFSGIRVIPPDALKELEFDKIIIMVTNVFQEQVYKQLRFDMEIPENKIEFCDYLSLL